MSSKGTRYITIKLTELQARELMNILMDIDEFKEEVYEMPLEDYYHCELYFKRSFVRRARSIIDKITKQL